jgi:hypothetical protein
MHTAFHTCTEYPPTVHLHPFPAQTTDVLEGELTPLCFFLLASLGQQVENDHSLTYVSHLLP